MKNYYYEAAGQHAGPLSADELRAHGVQGNTLVWCDGMSQWEPAASLEELTALFQPVVPPPLPKRPGPPPLPSPVLTPTGISDSVLAALPLPSTPVAAFAASGYSVPQLGVFKDDTTVYALESGELVASFADSTDLDRVYKDGLWFNEAYRFALLDATGKKLLTFYKPAKGIMQSLKHELHILDAQDHLLGICRNRVLGFANPFSKQDGIITVTDAYSQTLLELDSLKELKFNLTIELVQRGQVVGTVLGSKGSGGVSRALFVYARDRFELRFKPEVEAATKAVGLGAVLALHLFVRHRWR
jgi:hypothetical protein